MHESERQVDLFSTETIENSSNSPKYVVEMIIKLTASWNVDTAHLWYYDST